MFDRTRAPFCWGLSRGSLGVVVVVFVVVVVEEDGEGSGAGWEMIPMPSLLAEPSQPRARRRRFLGGCSTAGDIFLFLVPCVTACSYVGGIDGESRRR